MAMGRFFEQYDLLLTPATTTPAFAPDQAWPPSREDPAEENRWFNSLLYPFNLTGDPACSVPMGRTSEGLPAGLQIVGPRYHDARVLRAAKAFEELRSGDDLRPPHGVAS